MDGEWIFYLEVYSSFKKWKFEELEYINFAEKNELDSSFSKNLCGNLKVCVLNFKWSDSKYETGCKMRFNTKNVPYSL